MLPFCQGPCHASRAGKKLLVALAAVGETSFFSGLNIRDTTRSPPNEKRLFRSGTAPLGPIKQEGDPLPTPFPPYMSIHEKEARQPRSLKAY